MIQRYNQSNVYLNQLEHIKTDCSNHGSIPVSSKSAIKQKYIHAIGYKHTQKDTYMHISIHAFIAPSLCGESVCVNHVEHHSYRFYETR